MRAAVAMALAVSIPLGLPHLPAAEAQVAARTAEFRFTPAARMQIALWIEAADGTFLKTVRLTQAVSLRGIGNRPGAAQMNSAWRWPYGRREGVLPVWAHRRAAAPGAMQFPRVIFQDRRSEGDASRTSDDSTDDPYFCLSFNPAAGRKEALDAITCATMMAPQIDKGRYVTRADVASGYAEPVELAGQGMMRPLDLLSLYPPRRDVISCAPSCVDRPEVASYVEDARRVMPDIDAVTMATPASGVEQSILLSVPDEWSDGEYVAFIEVNAEGDYNGAFNPDTYPTPTLPSGAWDTWAIGTGFAYRGQPSVVYRLPFTLGEQEGQFGTAAPAGYGDLGGFGAGGGVLHPMDGLITDDPRMAEGSGADRLRLVAPSDRRFSVAVQGRERCKEETAPEAPAGVAALLYPDEKHSHEWGRLHFVVPQSRRAIAHYEVRFATQPIVAGDPGSFERAMPAFAAQAENVALMVPTTSATGAVVEVDFGGMRPLTRYFIAIRAVDSCNQPGPYAVTELETTRINFTTLSGCFVATAAYGSPLEPDVNALRAVRDALVRRSALFAIAADLYNRSGPAAAALIAGSEVSRALVRTLLRPAADAAALAVAR